LGCAHILESKAGITGLEYKHLSFVCDGPEDDASATWKVDGETCADFGRQITGTDIWRCSASGHVDYSNHQLPVPNEVCCVCGYKIPKTAIDCEGQWTDKGIHGEDCGTYIITTQQQGAGKHCPIVAGTTVTCSTESKDCVGVWTEVGPKGDECGKFIITQQAQGNGAQCLSENGATRECELGESCRLTGGEDVKDGWSGLDTGDNYCNTCQCTDGVLLCTLMYCSDDRPCQLTGGTQVAPGWIGQDTGSNYCNTCQCKDGSLLCTKMACPPRCPIAGCIPPPEGCRYEDSPELDENGCPKYLCGILVCEKDHQATLDRIYMTRDKSMVTIYYTGASLNAFVGVVNGHQYSRREDISLMSQHIVDKKKVVEKEGFVNLFVANSGGPFFATMWNASGIEIAERKLFDKFTSEFLADNCPKDGTADRQSPWDDGLSVSGGVSHTCADYSRWSSRDQMWLCDTTRAGWDADRDLATAVTTCCACDSTGSLYAEWANGRGKNPYSCDLLCPTIPHFHSATKAFNHLLKTNSSCRTVHLRSCGGELVWSPCKGPEPYCRYTPASPTVEQLLVIELATKMYEEQFDTFTPKQWEYIWDLRNKTQTNRDLVDRLKIMEKKIETIDSIKKELDAIVVPIPIVPDKNIDWLNQLILSAKEDLLYRDLSTYPKLIQRLNEINEMIQTGTDDVSEKIRHAMRYDLTVLIEDVNALEQESREKDENLNNRTTSLEITVAQVHAQLSAIEQSHIGLSDLVQSEIKYIRKQLDVLNGTDRQIFNRIAELTIIAADFQEQLYANAVNDSRHDDAIASLEGELAVLTHWVGKNVTAFENELKEIARQGESLHWQFNTHVESVAWSIREMKEDIDDDNERVLDRLNIMENAFQEIANNVGESVRFIDRRVNELYAAVLDKADADELRIIEEQIITQELALKNYSRIQGELAFNKSSDLVDLLREQVYNRFNELGEVPTEAEIQLMIKQSFDECLALSKDYADALAEEVRRLAEEAVQDANAAVLEESSQYADEMAENARVEAIEWSNNYVNTVITTLLDQISQQYTTGEQVRNIVAEFLPGIDTRIEEIAERERNAMFLTIEQRAAELEAYAATIAESHAIQARINATNTAVYLLDNLRNELLEVNASLYAEFGHFAYKIPDIELMITHLYNEMHVMHIMLDSVENDIISNNEQQNLNVDELRQQSEQELAIVRHRMNVIIEEMNEFKEEVAANYVSKENFQAVQQAFAEYVEQQETRFAESLDKFNAIEHTIESLSSQIAMVVVSQDQKIVFLFEELNSLEQIAVEHSEALEDIKKDLGVLNKIQEDYPSIDLSNQISELHIRTTMASLEIIEAREELLAQYNNITELAGQLGDLSVDVDDQRRQILEMQNSILYGIPGNNLWNSIDGIRQELDQKLDQHDYQQLQQQIEFQRQQLVQLTEKLEGLKNGTNTSGIDLDTMARIVHLEESIQALLESPFACGTGEIEYTCDEYIEWILSQYTNMTIDFINNDARIGEILSTLEDMGDELHELKDEYENIIISMGTNMPVEIIRDIQEKIANTSAFVLRLSLEYEQDRDSFTAWVANIANDVHHLIEVTLSNSDEISKINRVIGYLNETIGRLPVIEDNLHALSIRVDEIRHFYGIAIENNQRIINETQAKVNDLIPKLDTLGYKQELYKQELELEIANIRNEFLDLPDSPRIQHFIGDLDEKIYNISLEVLKVATQQQHYDFQISQLNGMRNDIRSLQNITEMLYNMTVNQTYSLVINSSDVERSWINETLVPLVRRIDLLENVVSAHQNMNFSRQINTLSATIETHTASIHKLMSSINGTITLTEEQLDELAHRVAILEPTQEVLQIRDDLDRLIRMEKDHPLVNISQDIASLDTRISAYETMLPPETLEAILKDIEFLKNKLNNNTMLNDGEILIIQAQIRQLVEAAEKHTEDVGELEDIIALLDESSIDHETALAEIEIELDALEHAIQVIISNGPISDLGIPNEIQELHDEDEKTRDMVHYLQSQIEELKHRLRYYASCDHTSDCRPGQKCSHEAECLWDPGSVVCAWEKLHCDSRCTISGDCNMLKHVWHTEFKDHCRPNLSCGTFEFANDDVVIGLIGNETEEVLLGYTWNDPGVICRDSRFKYDVVVGGEYVDTTRVFNYTVTYKCANVQAQRTVAVVYPVCNNSWIMCNGYKKYPSKFHNCSIPCVEVDNCDHPRYAGPACECSPFLHGCEDWLGSTVATWSEGECGCRCSNQSTYVGLVNNKHICR
jgi:DNA repair exonuclease SbcCD ATPase subunit